MKCEYCLGDESLEVAMVACGKIRRRIVSYFVCNKCIRNKFIAENSQNYVEMSNRCLSSTGSIPPIRYAAEGFWDVWFLN